MAVPTTNPSTVASHARRIFSQRAQATMLSLALAVSATLPAGTAVAQEGDQEREGVAAPEQTAPPDSTTDPDFDPGGDNELPFDVGAPDSSSEEEDSGDGAPIDTEPATDPEALTVPLDDPAATVPDALDGTDAPTPPAEPAPLAPLPAPAPVQLPAATVPQQTNPDRRDTGDGRDSAPAKRGAADERKRNQAGQRPAIQVTLPAPAEAPPGPAVPTPVAATATPVQSPSPPSRERVGPGRATYTVQPGDSLWSIASRTLDSTATNAEIVAESNRIYQLNRGRIGPDPDLLAVGTVLRLR
jgi:hypothetical protein